MRLLVDVIAHPDAAPSSVRTLPTRLVFEELDAAPRRHG